MIPDPDTAAFAALQEDLLTTGVLSRRFFAWIVDGVLIGLLLSLAWTICLAIGVVTFGLAWPIVYALPAIPLLYHWLTLASPMSASPGQALFGLVVRRDDDLGPPGPIQALVFTVLLYLTLALGAVWTLVGLFTTRHRMFHDMLSGLVVVRAQALTRAAAFWNMRAGPYAPGGRPRA
jgi:uncharacterized RDD family membrane protein YckC